ncbi:MAG: hypothetical protein ACRC41_09565 [Sarcina sp.]
MLLVFCNNYREVEKLNIFRDNNGIPYIEFYIPRKTVDFKLCDGTKIEEEVNIIKNNLAKDEWISNLNISSTTNTACINFEITKEVMYEVPIENANHREVKEYINTLIRRNEVIDLDKLPQELNKSKASGIAEFAGNIIKRI